MSALSPLMAVDARSCRACWHCVRLCPTHAVRAIDGAAEVIAELCVGCGSCVGACRSNSFFARSDGERVDDLLARGGPVVALLATEFVAAMHPMAPEAVERALESAGFYAVESTTLGEEMVALEYEARHADATGVPVIRSTCPVVSDWVRRYHPALTGALAPVVPPYVAAALVIKSLYPEGTSVVYVSPCYARKDEAMSAAFDGAVDVAIDFAELRSALVRLEATGDGHGDLPPLRSDRRPEPLKEISLTDGYPRSTMVSHRMTDPEVAVVRGLGDLDALLNAIAAGECAPAIVDALNCEGCIDGPTVNPGMSLFAKKNLEAADRHRRLRTSVSSREIIRHLPPVDLRRSFEPDPLHIPVPDEARLLEILRQGGLLSAGEALDCGGCGYTTCREHAAAIFRGDSTWEVCFPLQRRRLWEDMEVLRESATLDPLTGLWNRRVFSDRLLDDCARHVRYGGHLCLLMLDLDAFKTVNDHHGHLNGDMVLTAVADLLRLSLRSTDLPCRYGGDEFAVVLPETTKTDAFAVAEKVRTAVEGLRVSVRGDGAAALTIRISIGVASARRGEGPQELLEAADRALYKAKEMGRNQVRLAPD